MTTQPNREVAPMDRTDEALDAFEQGYAERSGVTVGFLHSEGLRGEPCECGEEGCEGWAMNFERRLERKP